MIDKNSEMTDANLLSRTSDQVGFYSAILLAIITIITFGFALTAIPISGANCPEGCIGYPYLNTLSQFPKDFIWMYFAVVLILVYVILMVSIHIYAAEQKKIFSQIGVTFAIISSVILLIDYYIQFSVIPISLMNGEIESIPILIQYNPHGIFLVLEELGYLMMSISFLFVSPVFTNGDRIENAVRWVFIVGFILTAISFILISIIYGINRMDRLEVAVISIDWLVLIVNGVLLSFVFKRHIRANNFLNPPDKISQA